MAHTTRHDDMYWLQQILDAKTRHVRLSSIPEPQKQSLLDAGFITEVIGGYKITRTGRDVLAQGPRPAAARPARAPEIARHDVEPETVAAS